MSAAILAWLTTTAAANSALVYVLLGSLVFAEDALFLGFVIPGETAAILGGALAGGGGTNIVVTISVVVAAAFLGDLVGFVVGSRLGHRLLRLRLFRGERSTKVVAFVRRHGMGAVILGRFTAFLRATTPADAGISKMPPGRFVSADAAGALVWGTGMPLIGFFGGAAVDAAVSSGLSWVALSLVGVIVAAVLIRLIVRRRRSRRL